MNRKRMLWMMLALAITLSVVYMVSESSLFWTPPQTIIGNWGGLHKINLRHKTGQGYQFAAAPHSSFMLLSIQGDGRVTGNLGGASFSGCKVYKNRGVIGKALNLATDYVIQGKLEGAIFLDDTIVHKKISIPFNQSEFTIKGTMFHKQGLDLYPMTEILLGKRG